MLNGYGVVQPFFYLYSLDLYFMTPTKSLFRPICHIFSLVLFFFIGMGLGLDCALAQSPDLRKGDESFEKYAFSNAIKHYLKLTERDYTTNQRLAQSYRYIGNTEEAEIYYAHCATSEEPLNDDIYFYAAMLRSNGKYSESEVWMDKYHTTESEDTRGIKYFQNHGLSASLAQDQGNCTVQNLDINSSQEDFGAVYFKDKIVFASSREGVKPIMRRWNWNELPFLDLYMASPAEENQLMDPVPFDKNLNNKYHEGPASFSNDFNFIAFTRNNYNGKSSDDIIKLQIYTKDWIDGKWKNELAFPYNSAEYSVGHPALSPDGNTIYFASDMPGGFGSVDLYKSERTDTGWSNPENLGKEINTEGKEMFPFYHPDGYLIFASDGHVGVGGLDNFIVPIKSNGQFGKIVNMGYPVNDIKDDFAVVLDSTMKKGYFSSNRPGGKGDDDLYSFDIIKPYAFGKTIRGIAQDESGNPLRTAVITLWEGENMVGSAITFSDGSYAFEAEENKEYRLNGSKRDYSYGTCETKTNTDESEFECNIVLKHNGINPIKVASLHPNLGAPKKVLMLKGMEDFFGGGSKDLGSDLEEEEDPFLEEEQPLADADDEELLMDLNSKMDQPPIETASDEDLIFMEDNDDPFGEPILEEKTPVEVVEKPAKVEPIVFYWEIRDHETGELIDSVEVDLVDNLARKDIHFTTTNTGGYELELKDKTIHDTVSYTIHMAKHGYMSISVTYDHDLPKSGRYNLHEELNLNLDRIEVGMDIAKIINIGPIYFDVNKHNIRKDAAHELDKIVEALNENPGMEIELKSHTDCRASAAYNLNLSDQRAKSSAKYIHDRITSNPERIYGKGYGESEHVNECECEGAEVVPCTEEQHQANRRTEFTIVKVE